jgi:alpha-beta hydrolase superfamily lysophospholipase
MSWRREERLVRVAGGRCAATLDRPCAGPRALVVLAHGLTGERVGPAGLLAGWTRGLARAGIAAVRFDARGAGDSSGRFHGLTFAGMESDYLAVAAWAAGRVGPVPVVAAGISMGGVTAVLAAPRLPRLAGVLLLSADLLELGDAPVPDAPGTMRDGEFELGLPFLAERHALRPRGVLAALGVPCLLVYGTLDGEVAEAAPALRALGTETAGVPAAGHLFESVRARARLLHDTTRFVERLRAA